MDHKKTKTNKNKNKNKNKRDHTTLNNCAKKYKKSIKFI